jgi:hypothetical protein
MRTAAIALALVSLTSCADRGRHAREDRLLPPRQRDARCLGLSSATFANGILKTAAFDDDRDGRADRRWTYDGARLVLVESEPDASGRFTKRTEPRQ